MAMAGTGIMNSNIPPQAKAYFGAPAGTGALNGAVGPSAQTNGEVLGQAGVRGTTNLGISPQKIDQYNS